MKILNLGRDYNYQKIWLFGYTFPLYSHNNFYWTIVDMWEIYENQLVKPLSMEDWMKTWNDRNYYILFRFYQLLYKGNPHRGIDMLIPIIKENLCKY